MIVSALFSSSIRRLGLVCIGLLAFSLSLAFSSSVQAQVIRPENVIKRAHLQFSQAAMLSGKATVAFMGGSITEMDGYRPMMMKELQRRYPDTDFSFIDAGMSSTCSTTGAFRFKEYVLAHGVPDLFFLEFAVNDDQDAGHARTECIRGMEGIIRQARTANPEMDIIVTYFVNEHIMKTLQDGTLPVSVAAHEEVMQHYNVSVSFLARQAAIDIQDGVYIWKTFGGVHPKPFGNRINANLISNLLDQVDAPFVAKAIPPYDLPAKLDPHSYANPQFLLPDAASGGVVHQPDWDKLKGGKRKRFVRVDMHCLTEKGQRCELAFEGKTVGAFWWRGLMQASWMCLSMSKVG